MKYHDSITEADKKMTLSVKQLRQWNLPTTPINYAVSYEFITQKNSALNHAISSQIKAGRPIDIFFIEEMYKTHMVGQQVIRDELIADIDEVIGGVQSSTKRSAKSIDGFVSSLDQNISNIQSQDKRKVSAAVLQLRKSSKALKAEQQRLQQALAQSQAQTNNLRSELATMRKEVLLDPLTRFYNRKAMSEQLDVWFSEDPNKDLSAIVVNVNDLTQYSQKFGPLISDVLLSKVAKKISSYVDDSGLPVRSGGDEFIILLPEVEKPTAQEIADKIRQGVEKLRFVSSKSGIRLPQMTVSVGVGEFKVAENANTIIRQARHLVKPTSSGSFVYN